MAAVYDKERGMQSILNAALGEYHARDFCLVEPDSHILELYYNGELVCRFNQSRATIPVIHEACREHLEFLSAS